MADTDEKLQRRQCKADAFHALLQSLEDYAQPTSMRIFDALSQAHQNQRNAESSRLARETLLQEDPQAEPPEELSLSVIAGYHSMSGGMYESAALDYLFAHDLLRAYTYARKACRQWRFAAEMVREESQRSLEHARECCWRCAMIRQEIARRSLRRRRWSLGLLGRMR